MTAASGTHVEMDLSKEIIDIIDQYPSLSINKEKGKIQCKWSGHEMPCRADVLASYVKGKKFKKLLEQNMYNYDKYKEHIVPSIKKGRGYQLFCKITERHLNNRPEHIQKHIEGRRFQKAFKRWEECQKNGTKFIVNPGRRRKRTESDTSFDEKSDEDDEDSDVDSLSDLYPDIGYVKAARVVGNSDEDDIEDDDSGDENNMKDDNGSDFDFDDLEMEENHESQNTTKLKPKIQPGPSGSQNKSQKKLKQQTGKKRKSSEILKKHKKMRT